jgi:hypothetical protein
MATLELVPLRSKFPYSGHMTVRFSLPALHPDGPLDRNEVEDLADILDSADGFSADGFETTATPQVADGTAAGETVVRKGVQAR